MCALVKIYFLCKIWSVKNIGGELFVMHGTVEDSATEILERPEI